MCFEIISNIIPQILKNVKISEQHKNAFHIMYREITLSEVILNERKTKLMATFYNQATLTYNGGVINSNVVTGELIEVLSVTKTAVNDTYTSGDTVTYVISIVNSGTGAFTDLTVSDDLGSYQFGSPPLSLTPLTYVDGSLLYYVNGVLQATPTVTETPGALTVSGITVPANGNALIVYEASVNQYAPIGNGTSITNTVTVSGGGLTSLVTDTETVTAAEEAVLSISKAISPSTVADNGQLTYTFVIENNGTSPVIATDNVVVSDTFDPILAPITVSYDGVLLAEGTDYTYNTATGEFVTVAGRITVPAATVTQDPTSGVWVTTPGVGILRILGTV